MVVEIRGRGGRDESGRRGGKKERIRKMRGDGERRRGG